MVLSRREARKRGRERGRRPRDGDGLLARVRSVGREESECERKKQTTKRKGVYAGRRHRMSRRTPKK